MLAIIPSFPSRRARHCVVPVIVLSLLTACGSESPSIPPASVTTISVTPTHDIVVVGLTRQMIAATLDANGVPLMGRQVSWATSDASKMTVSPSGVVTGVSYGTATITATSEGRSGYAELTSVPIAVITVEVTPQDLAMNTGNTKQLTARTLSNTGYPLPGRVVTWSSSDVSKATVSESGLATAVAPGSATITATSEGRSGSTLITVMPAPAASR